MLNVTLFATVCAFICNVRTRPCEVLIKAAAITLEGLLTFRGLICVKLVQVITHFFCVRFLDIFLSSIQNECAFNGCLKG